jgi:hypothetical protein
MKKSAKSKKPQSTTNTASVNFSKRLQAMEAFLLEHLPFLEFACSQDRPNKQRLVLVWDGLKIVAYKKLAGLPVATAEELEQALVGFREDLMVVCLMAGIKEKAPF